MTQHNVPSVRIYLANDKFLFNRWIRADQLPLEDGKRPLSRVLPQSLEEEAKRFLVRLSNVLDWRVIHRVIGLAINSERLNQLVAQVGDTEFVQPAPIWSPITKFYFTLECMGLALVAPLYKDAVAARRQTRQEQLQQVTRHYERFRSALTTHQFLMFNPKPEEVEHKKQALPLLKLIKGPHGKENLEKKVRAYMAALIAYRHHQLVDTETDDEDLDPVERYLSLYVEDKQPGQWLTAPPPTLADLSKMPFPKRASRVRTRVYEHKEGWRQTPSFGNPTAEVYIPNMQKLGDPNASERDAILESIPTEGTDIIIGPKYMPSTPAVARLPRQHPTIIEVGREPPKNPSDSFMRYEPHTSASYAAVASRPASTDPTIIPSNQRVGPYRPRMSLSTSQIRR